jgi:hypothetical protein
VPLACKANRYWFLAKLGQPSCCQHYQHSSALVSTGSALVSTGSAPGQHYQHLSALGVMVLLPARRQYRKRLGVKNLAANQSRPVSSRRPKRSRRRSERAKARSRKSPNRPKHNPDISLTELPNQEALASDGCYQAAKRTYCDSLIMPQPLRSLSFLV